MKVGFTGTQKGMSARQVREFLVVLEDLKPKEFHHGDCIGADSEAHELVRKYFPKVAIHIHPPLNMNKRGWNMDAKRIYDSKEYLQRNKDIVNQTDVLVAAPAGPETLRSGTWSTVRYARRLGKPRRILDR